MVRAVLTDLEGVLFLEDVVKDLLIPYSKSKIPEFVKERSEDPVVKRVVEEVRAISGQELNLQGVVDTLLRWLEEGRKSSQLKEIQLMVWEEGLRSGELAVKVSEASCRKLKELKEKGLPIYTYSPIPEKVQKLLLSRTQMGDLTGLFSGYFDKRVGSRKKESTFKKVAKRIGLSPEEVLYFSTDPVSIEAAEKAGVRAVKVEGEGIDYSLNGH